MSDFFNIQYEGTDLSNKLKDFGTASVGLELQIGEFIYIGFRKPFKQFFVELSVKNTNANIITSEYYNGTTWVSVATMIDESEGFTKSGFFLFEKPVDWVKTTVGTQELFFIRLSTDASHSALTAVQGIGVLLSNDLDLQGVRSNIVSKHNSGASWVLKHEQARKDIVQMLNNRGNRIVKNADNVNQLVTEGARFADLTEFDLLEPVQLRQASLYKVISMIYLDELSDEIDDKWQRQGDRYEKTFLEMMGVFYLQIDMDDDGKASDIETTNAVSGVSLSWQ